MDVGDVSRRELSAEEARVILSAACATHALICVSAADLGAPYVLTNSGLGTATSICAPHLARLLVSRVSLVDSFGAQCANPLEIARVSCLGLAWGTRYIPLSRAKPHRCTGLVVSNLRRHQRKQLVPTEIERKFLVSGADWRTSGGQRICQGYLNHDKQRTVRVRIADPMAYLTIKGISLGASRAEFEYEIPIEDAESLLRLCAGPLVEKVRHRVLHEGLTWEVDEFLGENTGLVVAEVELSHENQSVPLPPWVTTEVTTDARYFNSNLCTNPFSRWA